MKLKNKKKHQNKIHSASPHHISCKYTAFTKPKFIWDKNMFSTTQLFSSRYDCHNRLPLGFKSAKKKTTKVLVSVMKLEMPVSALPRLFYNHFQSIKLIN